MRRLRLSQRNYKVFTELCLSDTQRLQWKKNITSYNWVFPQNVCLHIKVLNAFSSHFQHHLSSPVMTKHFFTYKRSGGLWGLVTAVTPQIDVGNIGLNIQLHKTPLDTCIQNILHVSTSHMPYSWTPPYCNKPWRSQQKTVSVPAALRASRFRWITSYNINLGRAPCQLKVEGAIIWVWTELAGCWPSMCSRLTQEWGHNMKIYIQLTDKAGQMRSYLKPERTA